MAEKIVMPKAGMSMETGVIVEWLKQVGDRVEYGEPILEIETDKTTMQVESMSDGYIIATLYGPGEEVPVVTTIGYIGEKDEQPPEGGEVKAEAAPEPAEIAVAQAEQPERKPVLAAGGKIPASPLAKTLAAERGVELSSINYSGAAIRAKDVPEGAKATPLARRTAQSQGIDLGGIKGSGHGGKIKRDDIIRSAEQTAATAEPGAERLVAFNGMRKTIARRMLESHTEIPPVTLNTQADVTALYEARKQMNEAEGVKISFNDLVMKACAVALREFPEINTSYSAEGIIFKEDINIGMAVALDDGLIVPVLKNADRYPVQAMSEQLKLLAEKAREGSLGPDEYSGGTFSVSNLGMFGITSFTPIINLPESCILGVCAIENRAVVEDGGSVKNHKYMGLSLTFDHRCVDGAGGSKFLQRVVKLLENPMMLLIL